MNLLNQCSKFENFKTSSFFCDILVYLFIYLGKLEWKRCKRELRQTEQAPWNSEPKWGSLFVGSLLWTIITGAKIRACDVQTDVEPRANSKSNNLSFILRLHSCAGHTSSLFLLFGPRLQRYANIVHCTE